MILLTESTVTSLIQTTCGHECCKQGIVSKVKKKRPKVSEPFVFPNSLAHEHANKSTEIWPFSARS